MTEQELILILEDIQKIRTILTLEQASKVPNLFPKIKEASEIKKGQRFNIYGEVFEAKVDISDARFFNPEENKSKWGKFTPKEGR